MASQSAASPDASGVRDQPIDLARLVSGVLRRRSWVLVPTLLALVGSIAFVFVATPRYTGVAKVLLENQESYYTRPEKAQNDPGAALDPEGVQSQAETLASANLARKAIDKLGLSGNPEFAGGGLMDALTGLFSRADPGDREGRLIDEFLSRLTAFPVPKSRVLQIEFSSRDPELAARGANVVATVFMESQEAAKKAAAKSAGAWLARKIEELRRKVAEADDKVEAFRAQSGLLASGNGLTVPAQQLSDLNVQLATARAQQSAANAKAQMLRAMLREGRLDETQDVAKDESLRRYAEQRVALKGQIAEAGRTLLPEHPRMKEMMAQLAALDSEMRAAAAKSARALDNDARLAGAQVETLSATLARQSKTVASGNADDVQLRALEMDAKSARDQLESYLQKYREAMARDAIDAVPADARVIATAETPRSPAFPKKGPTVLLATLATLLVSAGVAASAALMANEAAPAAPAPREHPLEPSSESADAARGSPRRLRERTVPPEFDETPPEVEGAFEPAAPAEAFRSADELAAALAEAAPEAGGLTALVAGDGGGRALGVALDTARRLSLRGATVLVDLGDPQPWLSDGLDAREAPGAMPAGLADLLAGRADYGETLRRDLSYKLDVIVSGSPIQSGDGVGDVLSALADAYDFVIAAASDWRSPAAAAALRPSAVAVVVAPAANLGRALDDLRAGLDETGPVVSGFLVPLTRERIDAAA